MSTVSRWSLPDDEALLMRAVGGRHTTLSAGTTPANRVRPEVVEVMRELGIEFADRKP